MLMVSLFRHNIFTKKGGSTSKHNMMNGPDTGKSNIFIFMLLFIGLCASADMVNMGEAQ